MSFRRASLIITFCLLPALVGLSFLGKVRIRGYVTDDNGKVTVASDITLEDDQDGDVGVGFMCSRLDGSCSSDPCAYCHTRPDSKSRYTAARHRDVYYKSAAVIQPAGQQVPFGKSGYLTVQSGQLKYYIKGGTLTLTAPAGSMLLRNRIGGTFLYMPGEPTLHGAR